MLDGTMSQFYINSVKRKMKWQRLDLENLQDQDSDIPGAGSNSISDDIRNQDSNEREEAITDLRSRLQNDFAHILRPHKHKLSENFKENNNYFYTLEFPPLKMININTEAFYFNSLKNTLEKQIQFI